MARTPTRLHGPALVSNSAATKYTAPAGETIQGWAGTAATVVLTITAWEKSI